MSEWQISAEYELPVGIPLADIQDMNGRAIADHLNADDARSIVRDHNAMPRLMEALGEVKERVANLQRHCTNLPDKGCFAFAGVACVELGFMHRAIEAALSEIDVVDDGTSAGKVKDD